MLDKVDREAETITGFIAISLILIYLPLVYAFGYLAIKCCCKFRVCMKPPAHTTIDFENEFPARMMEENTRAQSNKYMQVYADQLMIEHMPLYICTV